MDGRSSPIMVLYVARDRQGVKWFSKKPVFVSGFDLLVGDTVPEPVITNGNRSKYRILRNFKVKII